MQRCRVGATIFLAVALIQARAAIEFEFGEYTGDTTVALGNAITVYATVRATEGKLVSVKEYLGTRLVGNYSPEWPSFYVQDPVSSAVAGDFPLTIVATDDAGNTATS